MIQTLRLSLIAVAAVALWPNQAQSSHYYARFYDQDRYYWDLYSYYWYWSNFSRWL